MHFRKLKQVMILPVLAILITSTILSFPLGSSKYVYSQPSIINSTVSTASSGVNLTNIHPSPTNLNTGNKFDVIATVVNNSPTAPPKEKLLFPKTNVNATLNTNKPTIK